MHVADHALRRGYGTGEFVLKRMARAILGNGGIHRNTLAVVSVLCIDAGARRITVIGINNMTAGTARRSVISRLFIGAEKPHHRVVQTGLGDVNHRHRDSPPRSRPTIGLFDIGAARLIQ